MPIVIGLLISLAVGWAFDLYFDCKREKERRAECEARLARTNSQP